MMWALKQLTRRSALGLVKMIIARVVALGSLAKTIKADASRMQSNVSSFTGQIVPLNTPQCAVARLD